MPKNQRENQYWSLRQELGLMGGVRSVKLKCWGHEDRTASATASLGDDGRILINCHAGCRIEDILAAKGYEMKDLYPPDQNKRPSKPPPAKREAEYMYLPDLKKVKMRNDDSSKFCFWQHLSNGKWTKGRNGIEPPLFTNGIESDALYIVEGEKDVLTLKLFVLAAVSLPDGADSKWKQQYAEAFQGKEVYIIQDNDKAGKDFAHRIASKLQGIASSVKVLDLTNAADLPLKADITDFCEKYGKEETLATIQALIATTPEWEPSMAPEPPATTEQPRRYTGNIFPGEQISIAVVKTALQDLGIAVRYNQLLKEVEIKGLPSCYSSTNAVNVLPAHLMDYLKMREVKGANQQTVDMYLSCIADEFRFNPIKEMLDSCTWDGTDRLSEIYRILGVTETKYQTYIRKWLIQCIALGLNEEENPIGAEGVLVLQGEQGLAKTSFFRIITPNPRWFCEGAVIDVAQKDTILNALGAWITELGELDSTLKREQSALKAFITSPADKIRAPYAKNATRTPRRTSFAGSVNPADYLRDETGSRRFWTVPVTSIDKKTLFSLPQTWAKQLWAQVYKLYQENPNGFRLTDEEMKQLQDDNRSFAIPLPYETEIRELLDYSMPVDRWQWWSAKEIRKFLPVNADAVKVGKALKKVVESLPPNTAPSVPPTAPKTIRKIHGTYEYFLPLKHFDLDWGERVG